MNYQCHPHLLWPTCTWSCSVEAPSRRYLYSTEPTDSPRSRTVRAIHTNTSWHRATTAIVERKGYSLWEHSGGGVAESYADDLNSPLIVKEGLRWMFPNPAP